MRNATSRAVLLGIQAALIAGAMRLLWASVRGVDWFSAGATVAAAVAVFALGSAFLARGLKAVHAYTGIPDLITVIHLTPHALVPVKWAARGIVSFLLGLVGGHAGPEGAAIEGVQASAHATRSHSSNWFEQLRRSDVATALSAGIAAAFAAPFAGFLLPVEMAVGGRALLGGLSALTAFVGIRTLESVFSLEPLSLARFFDGLGVTGIWTPGSGAVVVVASLAVGVIGALWVRLAAYSREGMDRLFGRQPRLRIVMGGLFLAGVVLAYGPAHAAPDSILVRLLTGGVTEPQAALLVLSRALGLSIVLAAIGTCGVFWPVLLIGGGIGYLAAFWEGAPVSLAVVVGGAAAWGAILGVPVTGAVLAYELTGNLAVVFPCLLAAYGATMVRKRLRTRSLFGQDLAARGLVIEDGRWLSVLESVRVRDAMVTDHQAVHEHDPVTRLHDALRESPYPFLAVVNTAGSYVGMLTADMVEDEWVREREEGAGRSNAPLASLLEAKDLLYRFGARVPVVRDDDQLAVTSGIFEATPVVPVLDGTNKVVGLLFAHNVRIAYEREGARRSLLFTRPPK